MPRTYVPVAIRKLREQYLLDHPDSDADLSELFPLQRPKAKAKPARKTRPVKRVAQRSYLGRGRSLGPNDPRRAKRAERTPPAPVTTGFVTFDTRHPGGVVETNETTLVARLATLEHRLSRLESLIG